LAGPRGGERDGSHQGNYSRRSFPPRAVRYQAAGKGGREGGRGGESGMGGIKENIHAAPSLRAQDDIKPQVE